MAALAKPSLHLTQGSVLSKALSLSDAFSQLSSEEAGGAAQFTEHLPSTHEVLSLSPNVAYTNCQNYVPAVLALGRWKQRDQNFPGHPPLYRDVEASLGYAGGKKSRKKKTFSKQTETTSKVSPFSGEIRL